MFVYEKKLQYPIRIANPNPQLAAVIISQYGGPDGELGASLRYLSQRYSMPYPELKGLLTDIGTEELGHLEMVGTIVHQLTRTLTQEQIEEPATQGWRGTLTRFGIRMSPNDSERAERSDVLAVSQHWPGPRTIAVVNGTSTGCTRSGGRM